MFFMGALAVSLKKSSFIPAGYLALGLSYAIQLTSQLKMAVRVSSTLEAQMNSVERVKFYSELEGAEGKDSAQQDQQNSSEEMIDMGNAGDIEMQDEKMIISKSRSISPPSSWPEKGTIRFEKVHLRYRDGPLVLKGVTFEVNAKEKIGIAGRTG